jgi:hypothetical protein
MLVNQNLGDATSDAIVQNVLDIAKGIWPEQTAEAETWINQQLAKYGISYAKYQAQQLSTTLGNYSWLLWLGAGFLVFKLIK